MHQPTLLIAEGDPRARHDLSARLTALGYQVVECCDGLSAVAKTRSSRVDALILNHEMPLGQSRMIATNVRRYTNVPIIFLFGPVGEDDEEPAAQLPNAHFLPRPLDDERLDALLLSLIRQRGPALPDSVLSGESVGHLDAGSC